MKLKRTTTVCGVSVLLCIVACLLVAVAKSRRPIATIPHQYSLAYEFRPGLLETPPPGAKIAHAHVARWAGGNAIRRLPTKRENILRFGMDTIFKVHTSFNRRLSESFVAIRQCENHGPEFRPDNNWFGQFVWPPVYVHEDSLLMFDDNDQLMSVIPLENRAKWAVVDGKRNLPVGVYLRRTGVSLTLVDEAPFALNLAPVEHDGSRIRITIANRSEKNRTIFWPEKFSKAMALPGVYFDVYNGKRDLWEDFKGPVSVEGIRKEDFRLFGPGETVSCIVPELREYYDPKPDDDEYTVRLHVHVTANAYPVSGGGNEKDCSVQMRTVDAWTGYLMSNEIKYRIAAGAPKETGRRVDSGESQQLPERKGQPQRGPSAVPAPDTLDVR